MFVPALCLPLCHVILYFIPARFTQDFKVLFAPLADGKSKTNARSSPGEPNSLIAAPLSGTVFSCSVFDCMTFILLFEILISPHLRFLISIHRRPVMQVKRNAR